MSNLGLERFLDGRGLRLERTSVGDRYVVERMRQGGWNLGGEQSGHIVMTDYATTGDGLIAALQFMAVLADSGKPASMLTRSFDPVPQLAAQPALCAGRGPFGAGQGHGRDRRGPRPLAGQGRLLIRKSGTEPLVRVMAECEDEGLMVQVVGDIIAEMESGAA